MADLTIASCIARASRQHLSAVHAAIDRLPQCEVFKSDGVSKLVVVVEGATTGMVLDSIERIRNIEHVLHVDLVYQHAEDETILQEAMPCN